MIFAGWQQAATGYLLDRAGWSLDLHSCDNGRDLVSFTRRDFLAIAAVGNVSAPEWRRYPDPATEFQVVRLTDPAFASGMTAPHLHPFTRRGDSLLYWSERGGSRQAFLLNLKEGSSRQLTDAATLDSATLSLSPDEREIFYFDGLALQACNLASMKVRELYRVPESSVRDGFTVGTDGGLYFEERTDGHSRIVGMVRGVSRRVAEVEGGVDGLMARPRHQQLLYRAGGALWLVNTDASGTRQLKTAPGRTGSALWTPSGKTLIYLHDPDDVKELVTLREHTPEDGTDRLLAKTSQFISASPNGDASVFTGASRSIASAYVLILLRVAHRELTLCEHRASDPAMVQPVFTPDSRSVVFVSDRHGKPAIYMVGVAKFVEQTNADTP